MASFAESKRLNLRAMGFCGVDETVSPELLQLLSVHYTWIEWGVLLRPDMEGQPRYPTWAWVERLDKVNKETGSMMRLAGHLCKQRCQEILQGDYAFAKSLVSLGFGRVQVNATAANGVVVDPARMDEYVTNVRACIAAVPELEWIIQANEETRPMWERLVVPVVTRPNTASGKAAASAGGNAASAVSLSLPANMSLLFDASCGTGVLASTFPAPLVISTSTTANNSGSATSAGDIHVPCGYAGGLGPDTIEGALTNLQEAVGGARVWVDMESRLRTITLVGGAQKDIFDIHKCFLCAQLGVTKFGLPVSKFSLLSI